MTVQLQCRGFFVCSFLHCRCWLCSNISSSEKPVSFPFTCAVVVFSGWTPMLLTQFSMSLITFKLLRDLPWLQEKGKKNLTRLLASVITGQIGFRYCKSAHQMLNAIKLFHYSWQWRQNRQLIFGLTGKSNQNQCHVVPMCSFTLFTNFPLLLAFLWPIYC